MIELSEDSPIIESQISEDSNEEDDDEMVNSHKSLNNL